MTEQKNNHSLIIIGAGAAALTASIYASRYKMEHIIIGSAPGGQVFEAHRVCNFPTEQDISGAKLVAKMQKHTESLGNRILVDEIIDIKKENNEFKITTQAKKIYFAKAVLLATGTEHRQLNLPDEDKFIGRGVSYCATCDALFYKDKVVAVVGGSDSANTASLYLAEIAKKVYQIYRKDKLRGETTWINQIEKNEKIEVIYETEVVGLMGENQLEKIKLSKSYKDQSEIETDGLFVEIGAVPQTALIKQLTLGTDEAGYVKVNADQTTSQEGVWAAGDITNGSNNFRQIITACSEGAIATENIFQFLQKDKI
ncbi:MAG: FAD-dependent oxidoreductase [Patescibacteria group bacterium]|nr:FAD-dependent oxidoreductase [Patescibacteria group bacterium]